METMSALQGLLGGVLIGLSATLLMGLLGRIAGVGGILSGLLFERGGDRPWRLAFLLGIVSGPGLLILSGLDWGNVAGDSGAVVGAPASGLAAMLIAGLLVGLGTGLGTGLGSGCTSGHGVCGLARLSSRSMAATLVFVLFAMLTVFVSRHWLGGAP